MNINLSRLKKSPLQFIAMLQCLIFSIFFIIGLTGSSFGLVSNIGVTESDEFKILGNFRPIRSDEWAVGTLLSIAQYNNRDNQFPIVNYNLGEEGKNLAIAHDTGVPVRELSAIAKPATWGFHIFDLRHALSWYWLIPLLISINGIWLLLNTIWEKQITTNFLLSLALTFSPHNVAWSFWPAYQEGLAAISTAIFLLLLKSDDRKQKILLSVVLGIFISSLALTLYLPRLIPIITLMFLVVVAYIWQNKIWVRIFKNSPYLLLSIFILVLILGSWYINNSEAILSILNSTYPGSRRVYGGGFGIWDFIRGWFFPVTLYRNLGISNECELSSYINLLIPITIFSLFFYKRLEYIDYAIFLFIGYALAYQYFGLPEWLGSFTFWDRSLPNRIDIGIEFSQYLLFASIYSKHQFCQFQRQLSLFFSVGALLIIILMSWISLPEPVYNFLSIKPYRLFLIIILLLVLHFSFFVSYKKFPALLAISTLLITIMWHPLSIAPTYVKLNFSNITYDKELLYDGKILVATGDHVVPNLIAATGAKVLNSTSHYVDSKIYDHFYKNIDDGRFKKFNHMRVFIESEGNVLKISSYADCIDWRINGKLFDFRELPVDFIITNNDKSWLSNNKTVYLKHVVGNYALYEITR